MGKSDSITAIVLMMLGIATAFESWRMPRFTEVGSSIWASPGIVPGLLGIALFIMAAILFLRTRTSVANKEAVQVGGPGSFLRIAIVVGFCVFYAGVLVSRVPFWLATFLFVFAFITVFELFEPEARRKWIIRVAMAVVIAALTSGIVSYVFSNIFFVRLP